ncbi:hypothetical protein JKP88DRAFT_250821 [Tribonema minus]|uniref:Uncharacterized protein n=1 Tax=Tribonema minus TaxID=303371 RepID=A0A835ZDF9_9STRA|nr:hypothetical protein JKP88DRAFT_250821 [Tribonema minus]
MAAAAEAWRDEALSTLSVNIPEVLASMETNDRPGSHGELSALRAPPSWVRIVKRRETDEAPMVITQLPARPQRSNARPTSAASALTQASSCHAISSSLSLDSTLAARMPSTDSRGERSQELRQQFIRRRAKSVRRAPDKSSHQPMKPTTRDSSRNGAGRPEHCSSVEHCDDAERCDAVRRRRRWRTRPAAPCGTCGEEPSALWCATCRVAYCLRQHQAPMSLAVDDCNLRKCEPISARHHLRNACTELQRTVAISRRACAPLQIADACDEGLQLQHSPAPQTLRRPGCTSAFIGSGGVDPHHHKRRPRVLPPEPQLRSAADSTAALSAADSVAALRRQRAKTSAARPPSRSLWRALQAAPVATLSLSGAAAAQPSAAARGVVNMRGRAVHVAPVQ